MTEYSEKIKNALPEIPEVKYDPLKIKGIKGVISGLDFGAKFFLEKNGENSSVYRHFNFKDRLIVCYEKEMDNDGVMWAVPKIKGGDRGIIFSSDPQKQDQINELDRRILNHLGKCPIKIELPEPVEKLPIPEWVIGKDMSSRFYFSSEAEALKKEFIRRLSK